MAVINRRYRSTSLIWWLAAILALAVAIAWLFGAFTAGTEEVRYVAPLSQEISTLVLLRPVEDARRRQARCVGPVTG